MVHQHSSVFDKRQCSIGGVFSQKSVKSGEVLCARSIEPFESGRWRLRWMRAMGWARSNG
jgi:hypothetical protein